MDVTVGGALLTKSAEAMVANFYAADAIAQREFRDAVREHAVAVVELTRIYCPVDTGLMRSLVSYDFSPSGLQSTQGWYAADFARFGEPFYPPYQEFGTIRNRAQPSLYPATMELRPVFIAHCSEIAADAILRAMRGGRL